MSDQLKHECGIAMLRLLKPLEYYQKKYGTSFYGIQKMYLLLEKQHNRGQDGAGFASIKMDVEPGTRYISRVRSNKQHPIQDIFKQINNRINTLIEKNPDKKDNIDWQLNNMPYVGNVFLGHVRYGTFGKNSIESVHPFLRQNNWRHKNLIMAGNFNMTNSNELLKELIELGQHPKENTDTVTIMEKIGHFLDDEVADIYQKCKEKGIGKKDASAIIEQDLDIKRILQRASKNWDGGYAMTGLIGHGDAFVFRDPAGIRPAFYYKDDEVVVVASERPVIQTVFNVPFKEIKELEPAHALIIKKSGKTIIEKVKEPLEKKSCSFERIYFSRGSDAEIYQERKNLGKLIFPKILKTINNDLDNTVFSYIPNTAETAFFGMTEEAENYLNKEKTKIILNGQRSISAKELTRILAIRPRIEKIAIKDAKLRTFIADDNSRDDLVAHVYDITYGVVKPTDNLVIIDDSIVRGTTLKKSILQILNRLNPKKIIIVSSAPQIRYPDCYGIDMAKLGDFIAFKAAIELLKDTNQTHVIEKVYQKCKSQVEATENFVKEIYNPFTTEEISNKIGELLVDDTITSEVKIIFQEVKQLHQAIPNHKGDWYFTGDYPTIGGAKFVNKAFVNYYEGKNDRAY
jgi:amidophosphoribosyltransferase